MSRGTGGPDFRLGAARGYPEVVDLVRGITGNTAGLGPRAEISRVERDAPIVFQAAHLSDGARVRDVSFDVRAGGEGKRSLPRIVSARKQSS